MDRGQQLSGITCRPLTGADIPDLVDLLTQLRPTILRQSGRRGYRALLKHILANRDGLAIVALDGGRIIGYVLGARHWSRFKGRFVLRHPLLGIGSFARRRRDRADDVGEPDFPERSDGPESGRIIHVGVASGARRRGVGGALYRAMARAMSELGLARMVAHIDQGNEASLSLHRAAGWTVTPAPDGFLATRGLHEPAADDG